MGCLHHCTYLALGEAAGEFEAGTYTEVSWRPTAVAVATNRTTTTV